MWLFWQISKHTKKSNIFSQIISQKPLQYLYFYKTDCQRKTLLPHSSMAFFVVLHEDFFPPLLFSVPRLMPFPAAPLSLSFSVLHLSFQTHSWGVRFLQLVHINAPISCAPFSLFLCSFIFFIPLLYLMLTSAYPGKQWGVFSEQWTKPSNIKFSLFPTPLS